MFFEEGRDQNKDLFECVVSSDNEFTVSRRFSKPGGPNVEIRTFQMTPRGPVFVIPLSIPGIGPTEFENNYETKLVALEKLFFRAFPDRKQMRYGIIRSLIFDTGKEPCTEVLAAPRRQSFVVRSLRQDAATQNISMKNAMYRYHYNQYVPLESRG